MFRFGLRITSFTNYRHIIKRFKRICHFTFFNKVFLAFMTPGLFVARLRTIFNEADR